MKPITSRKLFKHAPGVQEVKKLQNVQDLTSEQNIAFFCIKKCQHGVVYMFRGLKDCGANSCEVKSLDPGQGTEVHGISRMKDELLQRQRKSSKETSESRRRCVQRAHPFGTNSRERGRRHSALRHRCHRDQPLAGRRRHGGVLSVGLAGVPTLRPTRRSAKLQREVRARR